MKPDSGFCVTLADLALDAPYALGLAALAQVAGIERCIEVIGVVDAGVFRR